MTPPRGETTSRREFLGLAAGVLVLQAMPGPAVREPEEVEPLVRKYRGLADPPLDFGIASIRATRVEGGGYVTFLIVRCLDGRRVDWVCQARPLASRREAEFVAARLRERLGDDLLTDEYPLADKMEDAWRARFGERRFAGVRCVRLVEGSPDARCPGGPWGFLMGYHPDHLRYRPFCPWTRTGYPSFLLPLRKAERVGRILAYREPVPYRGSEARP